MKETDSYKDKLLRLALICSWLTILNVFSSRIDSPGLYDDLLNSSGQLTLNSDSIDIRAKPNELIIYENRGLGRIKYSKIVLIEDTILNPIFNFDSHSKIRFGISPFYTNQKWSNRNREILSWTNQILIGALLLGIICFVVFVLIRPRNSEVKESDVRKAKWLSIFGIFFLAIVALVHSAYIYILGGIYISPLGMIAPSIITTILTQDFIKYYVSPKITNKNWIQTIFKIVWLFLPSIIFIISHLIAIYFYWLNNNNSIYEYLMSTFIEYHSIQFLGINIQWTALMIFLSIVLGLSTIYTRINDFDKVMEKDDQKSNGSLTEVKHI